MYISNGLPTVILGYPQSSYTREIFHFCPAEDKSIFTPEYFMSMDNKQDYQYIIGFSQDLELRLTMIEILDRENLFSPTFIHDSVVLHTDIKNIGQGSSITSFCTIQTEVVIGKHCLIESYSLVAHNTSIGNNAVIRSGNLIAGKVTIGDNFFMGLKSSVLEKISICDNVRVGSLSNVTKNITESGYYLGSKVKKVA